MNRKDTVQKLRELAADRENETMELPIELVDIINGDAIERSCAHIGVKKAMSYFADMLEE